MPAGGSDKLCDELVGASFDALVVVVVVVVVVLVVVVVVIEIELFDASIAAVSVLAALASNSVTLCGGGCFSTSAAR